MGGKRSPVLPGYFRGGMVLSRRQAARSGAQTVATLSSAALILVCTLLGSARHCLLHPSWKGHDKMQEVCKAEFLLQKEGTQLRLVTNGLALRAWLSLTSRDAGGGTIFLHFRADVDLYKTESGLWWQLLLPPHPSSL